MATTAFFGLAEISSWQLQSVRAKVELPPLQRGFVWKPSQVEQLWDSILRGFPIGSFLLAEDERQQLLLLDGQQRATSVTLGFYNPWDQPLPEDKFWSLKNVPVVWIDLNSADPTQSQRYVIRVLTRSHPWGYQRGDHTKVLSISDRKKALAIFEKNVTNRGKNYIDFDPKTIFPYDAFVPIPLSFLIEAVVSNEPNWKDNLITRCRKSFPLIETKHTSADYFDKLSDALTRMSDDLSKALLRLNEIQVPGIIVRREILNVQDDENAQDPTLFVRLNSSGTRIAGEELIYSIYKAAFPEAKTLIEHIGQNYVNPSVVITIIARIAYSMINSDSYPAPLTVNDFRKRIKEPIFRKTLQDFIGSGPHNSQAKKLFERAIHLLRSENNIEMPTAIVRSIVNSSPELLMMLLQSLRFCEPIPKEHQRAVLGWLTAAHWFCEDTRRIVQRLWADLAKGNAFWLTTYLSEPFYSEEFPLLHPFPPPKLLRKTLLEDVVQHSTIWNNLYPKEIIEFFKKVSHPTEEGHTDSSVLMWNNFANKIFWCKSMVLFAQRRYINETFGSFNLMDVLEDTNTPWDWDHIYPDSWIKRNWYINPNTKHWNNSIGNFRALALEENRSEKNVVSPSERLIDPLVQIKSFVKKQDYVDYWSKITTRINEDRQDLVEIHLTAVISRLCDIYEEWYVQLDIDQIFGIKETGSH